jgi:hypothetical protein
MPTVSTPLDRASRFLRGERLSLSTCLWMGSKSSSSLRWLLNIVTVSRECRSLGYYRSVALVRTDIYEEPIAFLQESHGITLQKTAFFTVTGLKISNPA